MHEFTIFLTLSYFRANLSPYRFLIGLDYGWLYSLGLEEDFKEGWS